MLAANKTVAGELSIIIKQLLFYSYVADMLLQLLPLTPLSLLLSEVEESHTQLPLVWSEGCQDQYFQIYPI